MPAGRPSKYDPAFCDVAREFLPQGYSLVGLAGEIGVSERTIYEWAEVHPEFSQAIKDGQAGAARWWEDRLRDIVQGGDGNATAAIFGLKNRSRTQWADINRTEHTGSEGGPIKTEDVTPRDKLAAFLNERSEKPG